MLLQRGYEVHLLLRAPNVLTRRLERAGAVSHVCNLLEPREYHHVLRAGVREAVTGVSSVFHLAGAIWPPKVETLYRVNVDGTKNLVDACVQKGVRRVLFMSTDSTCGHGTPEKRVFDEHTMPRPYRDYGISKWMAEEYLLARAAEGHLDVTILRGFWFFGPSAPPRQVGFVKMFGWPRQIVFGNGKNLRSITHVDNVVDAFFKAENNAATYRKWYWVGDEHGGRQSTPFTKRSRTRPSARTARSMFRSSSAVF